MTVKLNAASSVVEVGVIVTKRPVENSSRASVIEVWLSTPVTPAGRPERLRS